MRAQVPLGALFILALAGCGGGGGGGGTGGAGAGGGSTTPPAASQTIEFPRAMVTVQKTSGSLAAGATATLRLRVSDPQPATVTACIGGDWDTATPFTAAAQGSGIWTATIICPDPLPGADSILVRLTMADGEIVESRHGEIVRGKM